jgi:hypothetical protein
LYMPISNEFVEGKFIKLTWRFWKLDFIMLTAFFFVFLLGIYIGMQIKWIIYLKLISIDFQRD